VPMTSKRASGGVSWELGGEEQAGQRTRRGDGRQGSIDGGMGVECGRGRRSRGRDVDVARSLRRNGQACRSSAAREAPTRRGSQTGHGGAGQWAGLQSRLRREGDKYRRSGCGEAYLVVGWI
jgi:hypothetical protein